MNMKQVNKAMNIKQVNEASKPIANTEICFEVRAPSSRPRLHPEGFPITITFIKNYNHTGYPTPQSHSSSPEVVEPQVQEYLGDQKTTNPLLKTFFPYKNPRE